MPPYLQPLTTAEKFQHGYPATAPQLDWQSTHTSFYSFSSMRSAEYLLVIILVIIALTSCGGTPNDTVRRSTRTNWSVHGMTKNKPAKHVLTELLH